MAENDTIAVSRERATALLGMEDLLERLLQNPNTAPKAEEIISQVNPDAKFPYRERREAFFGKMNEELEKERTARKALEDKIAAREAKEAADATVQSEARMVAALEAEKAKRGFSDEMMQRVMDRMRDNNNPDVAAAAAFVAESVPKPPPAQGYDFLPTTVDTYGSVSGDDKWKKLHANSDQWLTDELRSIARDPEFARLGNG